MEPVVKAWCKTKKKTMVSKEWERMLAEVNKYLKEKYPSAFDGTGIPRVFEYKAGQVEITKKWRAAAPWRTPAAKAPSTPARASSALLRPSPPMAAPLSTPAASALSTPVRASSRLSPPPPVEVPLVRAPSAPDVFHIGSEDQDDVLNSEQIDMLEISDVGILGRPAGGSCAGGPQANTKAPSSTMPPPPPAKASCVPHPQVKAFSMASLVKAPSAPDVFHIGSEDQDDVLNSEKIDMLEISDVGILGRPAGGSCAGRPQANTKAPSSTMPPPPPAKASRVPCPAGAASSSSSSETPPMPPSSTSAAGSREEELGRLVLDLQAQLHMQKQQLDYLLDKSARDAKRREDMEAEKKSLEKQLESVLRIGGIGSTEPSKFVNLTASRSTRQGDTGSSEAGEHDASSDGVSSMLTTPELQCIMNEAMDACEKELKFRWKMVVRKGQDFPNPADVKAYLRDKNTDMMESKRVDRIRECIHILEERNKYQHGTKILGLLRPAPLAHLGSRDVSRNSRSSSPPPSSWQAPNGQQQQDPSTTLSWSSVNFDLEIKDFTGVLKSETCSDVQRKCMEQLSVSVILSHFTNRSWLMGTLANYRLKVQDVMLGKKTDGLDGTKFFGTIAFPDEASMQAFWARYQEGTFNAFMESAADYVFPEKSYVAIWRNRWQGKLTKSQIEEVIARELPGTSKVRVFVMAYPWSKELAVPMWGVVEFETEQELKYLLDQRFENFYFHEPIQCLQGPEFPIQFSESVRH
ncbi:unnamed protein product [Polarella glacialis]|nr:unnamed protein product [Polarella glacialis]